LASAVIRDALAALRSNGGAGTREGVVSEGGLLIDQGGCPASVAGCRLQAAA